MSEIERGQKFFVVAGMGFQPADQLIDGRDRALRSSLAFCFRPADQLIDVVEVEVKKIFNSSTFTAHGTELYCTIDQNAFRERPVAYERALAAQGHRVVLLTGKRHKHLEQWEVLIQEFEHEMPDRWVRENFRASEFACKHTGHIKRERFPGRKSCTGLPDQQGYMDRWFIERLQLSRKIAGIPYNINSGWRCAYWNAVVGGTPDSSHMKGLAADIEAITSEQRHTILGALIQAGFMRIGIRKDFIHVDDDPAKSQGIIWLY